VRRPRLKVAKLVNQTLTLQDTALVEIGRCLRAASYEFTTTTPATHARVNARSANQTARSLADIFGWSRPFDRGLLPDPLATLAEKADVLRPHGNTWRSAVRFSTLGQLLFVHSAYPTDEGDVVFFGPDTYRFARFLKATANPRDLPSRVRVVDIGCGSGVGGIYLSHLLANRCDVELVLGDINPQALRFSRINSALNECAAELSVVASDVLKEIPGSADFIIANPPYLVDGAKRLYRHGGGEFGSALSLRIVAEALLRLEPGGQLILYTGSSIVDGKDQFLEAVKPILARAGATYSYEEIDPDVFGEELEQEAYARVDRIAVVALTAGLQRRTGYAST
jgi:methylase of polypeptide subunit release factors